MVEEGQAEFDVPFSVDVIRDQLRFLDCGNAAAARAKLEIERVLAKVEDKRKTYPALISVLQERRRQDAKFGEQNREPIFWVSILAEELGELAQAALQQQQGGAKAAGLRDEAVHVAAVALSMIECIDRNAPSAQLLTCHPPEEKSIYICGPMAGYEDHNYPLFHGVAKRLREAGYMVYNPAEINAEKPARGMCLQRDVQFLARCVEIVLLPGWEHSVGAWFEVTVADHLCIERLNANQIPCLQGLFPPPADGVHVDALPKP